MRVSALMALAAAGLAVATVPAGSALASPAGSGGPLTVAVYGDSPYGLAAYPPGGQSGDTAELRKSPAFISTINADPSVREVIHVGDIHSGKDFCTVAYDNQIASLWQQFRKPVVYTPGDNEWTDCDRPAAGGERGPAAGVVRGGRAARADVVVARPPVVRRLDGHAERRGIDHATVADGEQIVVRSPLLLLDDVMSELDFGRRERSLRHRGRRCRRNAGRGEIGQRRDLELLVAMAERLEAFAQGGDAGQVVRGARRWQP